MAGAYHYFLLCLLVFITSCQSQSQSQSGFISIDCGIPEGSSYQNEYYLYYTSDKDYIDTGVNRNISSDANNDGTLMSMLTNLRSFPNGKRNCYTLKPVEKGKKYLLRAQFNYGNYDGLNDPPKFDLYVGVNLWDSVETQLDVWEEIIIIAVADFISICLVNTGTGTPFISVLDLRPLPNSVYHMVNEAQYLFLLWNREDYGGTGQTGFPDDIYDRYWYNSDNQKGWVNLNTTERVESAADDSLQIPSSVLKTAITTTNLSSSIEFSIFGKNEDVYVFMYFAELEKLDSNETREFDVLLNGDPWMNSSFSPAYLKAGHLYNTKPEKRDSSNFSIRATRRSSLPPILNALEYYSLRRFQMLPTDDGDVQAIMEVKTVYGIKKNWMGDPCLPREFIWDGLNCSLNSTGFSRIISLNLAANGLTGQIPASLAKLTAIQYLDLSRNNLTGEVPNFLAELPSLRFLNLAYNQLTGVIPQALHEKSANGMLVLCFGSNIDQCNNSKSSQKRKRVIVPIVAAASVVALVLLTMLLIVWRMKRRNRPENYPMRPHEDNRSPAHLLKQHDMGLLQSESRQFSYSELVKFTNNFAREIGRGGFGNVYHGYLEDGMQVAVKLLSQSSSQGAKEFQAEAQLLTRIHHRNLVSLVGYCNNKGYLALVYEYMPGGSLREHLSAKAGNPKTLSWRERIQIAVEAAQGLEYLHKGCNPCIIHRDVKTSNILLGANFEAKVGDFGLSRIFNTESFTHLTTAVAGTLGYVDPEYYIAYKVNEKSDVYSFGVVLFEVVTGLPPFIDDCSENRHIIQWVQTRLEKGELSEIVDPRMQGDYDASSIEKTVHTAMACTQVTSTQRASMNDVVLQLKECWALEEARVRPQRSTEEGTSTNFNDSVEMASLDASLVSGR